MQDEFDFYKAFNNLFQNWWKILALAVLAGLIGLVISFILPPMYQAEAIFHASIDFTEINFENLTGPNDTTYRFTQYDEDLALQVVHRMLLSTKDAAYTYALTLDPAMDRETFERNHQIQRYHAQWYLRCRHEHPETAQAIVNFWADQAWQALQNAQESDQAEFFVIVDLVSKASLPEVPQYRNRNTLVFAGTVIGFITGIILVDSGKRFFDAQKVEV